MLPDTDGTHCSTHRACSFPSAGPPTRLTLVTFTTFPSQNSPCRCASTQVHECHTLRDRNAIQSSIVASCSGLLECWHQTTCPNLLPGFGEQDPERRANFHAQWGHQQEQGCAASEGTVRGSNSATESGTRLTTTPGFRNATGLRSVTDLRNAISMRDLT